MTSFTMLIFKSHLKMKCGRIIASKVKLAQSIQERIKTKANCIKAIT